MLGGKADTTKYVPDTSPIPAGPGYTTDSEERSTATYPPNKIYCSSPPGPVDARSTTIFS